MLSGKAILALGEAQMRAVKSMWVQRRRVVINKHFPHTDDYSADGMDDMYIDLIHFSRQGLILCKSAIHIDSVHVGGSFTARTLGIGLSLS
jgi:hypothetical protein